MVEQPAIAQPSAVLLEFMKVGWFCFDSNGKIAGANSVISKLLDFPNPSAFCELNAWDLFAETVSRTQLQQSFENRANLQDLGVTLRCRDGRLLAVSVDVVTRPQDSASSKPMVDCLVKISPGNLNELFREYEHLQLRAQRQRTFAEALGRLIFSASALEDLPALLNLICQEAAVPLDIASTQIWLLQNDELVGVASAGSESVVVNGLSVPLSDTDNSIVSVFRSKMPRHIQGLEAADSLIHDSLRNVLRIHSILLAPIAHAGRILGVFVLANIGKGQPVESDDLEFLLQLSTQAGLVVDHARLFADLRVANRNIAQAYDATLMGWAKALEFRDQETKGHTERVVGLALRLARELGLGDDELIDVYRGALLHDIGKMAIPDGILLKPGPLSPEEENLMRLHPMLAYEMLQPIEYLRSALDIPYCHHEKWDGSGYPRGLKGEDIPFAARIFAVVDVWDALSYDRPYRKAWPRSRVIEHIRSEAGNHFEPLVVDRFFEILDSAD